MSITNFLGYNDMLTGFLIHLQLCHTLILIRNTARCIQGSPNSILQRILLICVQETIQQIAAPLEIRRIIVLTAYQQQT